MNNSEIQAKLGTKHRLNTNKTQTTKRTNNMDHIKQTGLNPGVQDQIPLLFYIQDLHADNYTPRWCIWPMKCRLCEKEIFGNECQETDIGYDVNYSSKYDWQQL